MSQAKIDELIPISVGVGATIEGSCGDCFSWSHDCDDFPRICPDDSVEAVFSAKDHGEHTITAICSGCDESMNIEIEGINLVAEGIDYDEELTKTYNVFLNNNFDQELALDGPAPPGHIGCHKPDNKEDGLEDDNNDEIGEITLETAGHDSEAKVWFEAWKVDGSEELTSPLINLYQDDTIIPFGDHEEENPLASSISGDLKVEGVISGTMRLKTYIRTQDNRTAKDEIKIKVISLNLSAVNPAPSSDEHEICHKDRLLIPLNYNNSDGDDKIDCGDNDLEITGGDPDLVKIALSTTTTVPGDIDGDIEVVFPSTVNVYENQDKEGGIITQTAYNLGDLPKTFYLEGKSISEEVLDAEVKARMTLDNGIECSDEIKFTVVNFDLDLDSDNNNGFGPPSRTNAEDIIEDLTIDPEAPGESLPGKYIMVNDDDNDNINAGDGIVDYADGFDWDGIGGNNDDINVNEQFTPIILQWQPGWFPNSKIYIIYSASKPGDTPDDPAGMTRTGTDPWYEYTPADGELRLWLKPGSDARKKTTAKTANAEARGDYVEPGVYEVDWFEWQGDQESNKFITLYIEAVSLIPEIETHIKIAVDPDGNGTHESEPEDTVRYSLVKINFMVGDVDSETGRGMIGTPDQVLSPMGYRALPVSTPRPMVYIDTLSVENVRLGANERFVADITVSGHITSATADIVPDNLADPAEVILYVAGQQADTIALQRNAEAPCLLRPYAANFSFSDSFTAIPILPYDTPIVLEVEDPATGTTGFDMASVRVLAARNQSLPKDGTALEGWGISEPVHSYLVDQGTSQPLKVKLNLGPYYTLEDIEAAGPEAISIDACRDYESESSYTASAGMELEPASNPIISNGDGVSVEILDSTNLGLEDSVVGNFEALVSVPGVYSEQVTVIFEETAADSHIYCSRYVEVEITLSSTLNPSELDTISVTAKKILWDNTAQEASADLQETDVDSKIFGVGDYVVSIHNMTSLSPTDRDEITVKITNTAMNLSDHLADSVETSINSLVFKTTQMHNGGGLPLTNDFMDAWYYGPWIVTVITHGESSDPGFFAPFMVAFESTYDIMQENFMHELYGHEHELVVHEDIIFSAGSVDPGVFMASGNLSGDFGAGHISEAKGFVWSRLRSGSTALEKGTKAYKVHLKLFEALRPIANARRSARFGANPGSTYGPYEDYTTGGADDPLDIFVNFVWNQYFLTAKTELGKSEVDLDVRILALKKMTADDPTEPVLEIPHTPDMLYWDCRNRQGIYQIGSKYLLGHWKGSSEMEDDCISQSQNVTDILHLNTGLGVYKFTPLVLPLNAIARLPEDLRKTSLIELLIQTGHITGDEADEARKAPVRYFDLRIKRSTKYRELVDICTLARSLGSNWSLDLFLAYDIASYEGFQVFGIDAFNDVISTEAGYRLAYDLSSPGSTISTKESLKQRLEQHIIGARAAFLQHPLNANRDIMRDAFFSIVCSRTEVKTTKPDDPTTPQNEERHWTIWGSTLSTITDANWTWNRPVTYYTMEAKVDAWVQKLAQTIQEQTEKNINDPIIRLGEPHVESLHQMVEMLMLIEE
jgi:hypothetical protein